MNVKADNQTIFTRIFKDEVYNVINTVVIDRNIFIMVKINFAETVKIIIIDNVEDD